MAAAAPTAPTVSHAQRATTNREGNRVTIPTIAGFDLGGDLTDANLEVTLKAYITQWADACTWDGTRTWLEVVRAELPLLYLPTTYQIPKSILRSPYVKNQQGKSFPNRFCKAFANGVASHIIKRVAFGPGAMNGSFWTCFEQDQDDWEAVEDVIIKPLLRFMVEKMNPLFHLDENRIKTVQFENWAKACCNKVYDYGIYSREYIQSVMVAVMTNPAANEQRLANVKEWLKGIPYELALIACKVHIDFYEAIPAGYGKRPRRLYLTPAQANDDVWENAMEGAHFGTTNEITYQGGAASAPPPPPPPPLPGAGDGEVEGDEGDVAPEV